MKAGHGIQVTETGQEFVSPIKGKKLKSLTNFMGLAAFAGILVVLLGCGTIPEERWWTYQKDSVHSSLYRGRDVALPLEMVWERSYSTEGGPTALVGPAVFGEDHVYVPVHQDHESWLVALRLTDGAEHWIFRPEGESIVRAYIHAPPVVVNDMIYAVFQIEESDGQTGVWMYALDREGAQLWKSTSDARSAAIVGTMTAANDLILYCLKHPGGIFLHAIRQDNGEEAWRFPIDIGAASLSVSYKEVSPIVINDMIIVPTWADIRAIKLEEPHEIWRFSYPEEARNGSPVYAAYSGHHLPHVYVSSVLNDGTARLYALDSWTGNQMWLVEERVSSVGQRSAIGAIDYGSRVVLLAGESIFGISPGSGNVMWSLQDDDLELQSAPAFSRHSANTPGVPNQVMFYTSQFGVYALNPFDGVSMWSEVLFTGGVADFNKLLGGVSIDHGLVVASIRNVVRAYASAE